MVSPFGCFCPASIARAKGKAAIQRAPGRMGMRQLTILGLAAVALTTTVPVESIWAADFKIALIHGRTGPLEAYAKQTEVGVRLGLEYATSGTMTLDGRKIELIVKD